MKNNDNEIKKEKAGNPIFILIIFAVVFAFLFFIPEIYKRYNSDIADFLGIGNKQEETENKEENKILTVTSLYQIGSINEISFNEISIKDVLVQDGKLYLNVTSDNSDLDLESLDYYIEFYEARKTFLGRRGLKGTVNGSLSLEIDVSNMPITTVTYLMLSHIDDNAIQPLESNSDESGLSNITCSKGNVSYEYEFYLKKLQKVTKKMTFTSDDMDEYIKVLNEYQKLEKQYNEFNGVTASIVENSTIIMFFADFDYNVVSSYPRIEDNCLYTKDIYNHVVKFKMEAEGYECE